MVRVHLSPVKDIEDRGIEGRKPRRGISSVGRAPALQAGGHEFESRILHWITEGESAGGAGGFGYRMYLENRIQEKKKYQETCRVRSIREGQDIRGNEETLTKKFEENERKKLAQNQRRQRYEIGRASCRERVSA